MFESVQKKRERNAAKTWTIAISVLVHFAGAMTLIGLSFWRIDKLAIKKVKIDQHQPTDTGLRVPKGEEAPARPDEKKTRKEKKPDEVTQPSKEVAVADTRPDDGPTTGAKGERLGRPDGDPDAPDTDFLPPGKTCLECTDVVIDEPPLIEKQQEPIEVAQDEMRSRRVAGGDILLPAHMLSRHRGQAFYLVLKVCVDADGGVPASVTVTTTSGDGEVDDFVAAGIARTWSYKPFMVNGEVMPVCFSVRGDYQIID